MFNEKGELVSKLNGSITGWNFKFLRDEKIVAKVTKKMVRNWQRNVH
jgi:uncharacterized protein YxjI